MMKIENFQHAKNQRFLSMKRIITILFLLVLITACAKPIVTEDNTQVTQPEVVSDEPIEDAPTGEIAKASKEVDTIQEEDLSELDDLSADLEDIDW